MEVFGDERAEVVRRLGAWAESAVAVSDDRIVVTMTGGRIVEIVMNDEDLEELFTGWGYIDGVVAETQRLLATMPVDCNCLVMDQYCLVPRRTPEPVADWARPSGVVGGEWVVLGKDGEVVSRFADWQDKD
ncbi:hypothetical protein [Nocardioides abyssi]|uniref:Uncharacterized protein n=1 Tax=Nocardioides abyssi TaxID=3058370 RepID=A0ABT8ESK2_9ACTN|nr:hypothetical protein [Nocardioides abyssi]MDN4161087.1 hypothetical protein [Nocardioides abyssi]